MLKLKKQGFSFGLIKWSLCLILLSGNFAVSGPPILLPLRGADDQLVIDSNDPSRYQMRFLDDDLGIFQPTIGVVISY